ncbi:hypothetical protein MRX96_000582 [Rhipicephalus microplus]
MRRENESSGRSAAKLSHTRTAHGVKSAARSCRHLAGHGADEGVSETCGGLFSEKTLPLLMPNRTRLTLEPTSTERDRGNCRPQDQANHHRRQPSGHTFGTPRWNLTGASRLLKKTAWHISTGAMRKLPPTSINIAPRLTGAFLGLRDSMAPKTNTVTPAAARMIAPIIQSACGDVHISAQEPPRAAAMNRTSAVGRRA